METTIYIIIGFLNLIAGFLATVAEFLKVSQLSENHRTTSLFFGKLARNIRMELTLPPSERSSSGLDFMRYARVEMERLMELATSIPSDITRMYEEKFSEAGLAAPEFLDIHRVVIYETNETDSSDEIDSNGTDASIAVRRVGLPINQSGVIREPDAV